MLGRCYSIVRDRGIYGSAIVKYLITPMQSSQNATTASTTVIAVSDMFAGKETGLVMFDDRQFNAELTLSLQHTKIPHFDLHYTVQLLNVSGMSVCLL